MRSRIELRATPRRWAGLLLFLALTTAVVVVFVANGCVSKDRWIHIPPQRAIDVFEGRDSCGPILVRIRWQTPDDTSKALVVVYNADTFEFGHGFTPLDNAIIDTGSQWDSVWVMTDTIPTGTWQVRCHYFGDVPYQDPVQSQYLRFNNHSDVPTDSLTIQVWSGHHTYAGRGETVWPARARELCARVVDTQGRGVNGVRIDWSVGDTTKACVEAWCPLTGYTARCTTACAHVHGATADTACLNGLAQAALKFKDWGLAHTQACTARIVDHPDDYAVFLVHQIGNDDTEIPDSTLGIFAANACTYENGTWVERIVVGDGLWDDADPSQNALNLLVEVDYDPNWVPLDTVIAACDTVASIYSRIGIDVDFVIDSASAIIVPVALMDVTQLRELLIATRNPEHSGLGKGAVHAILGGWFVSDFMGGIAVSFQDTSSRHEPAFLSQTKAAHNEIPSEWEGGNEHLNQTGVFVFNPTGQIAESIPMAAKYGATLAHELGHALGLTHNDTCVNLMSSRPSFAEPWDSLTRFIPANNSWDRINLRWLLGREKIVCYW